MIESEWNIPTTQNEYSEECSPDSAEIVVPSFGIAEEEKHYGHAIEAVVPDVNEHIFIVSSEMGGNKWNGFVSVYKSWFSAVNNLDKPIAYFANHSTYSCGTAFRENTIVCGCDSGMIEFHRYTVLENVPDVRPFRIYAGHDDVTSSISLSAKSNFLYSGSFDSTSKTWDIDSGTCTSTSDVSTQPVLSISASREDDNLYCMASRDGKIYLIDGRLCSGVPASVLLSKNPSQGAYPTVINWQKDKLYAGYSEGTLLCYDLRAQGDTEVNMRCSKPHQGAVTALDFCQGLLASGGEDGRVYSTDFSKFVFFYST